MAHNPNDGSNDNPDEFSELRNNPTEQNQHAENLQEGAKRADSPMSPTGQPAGDNAVPQTSGTPNYGDFGHAGATTGSARPAGMNPGGVAAPNTAAPEQRGSAPQNQDTAAIRATHDASEEERREAYKQDDPRYGGGTRNWESAEPANRTEHSSEDPNDNTLS